MTDILVKPRGKNFWVIPQTVEAEEFLRNETGAIPYVWDMNFEAKGSFMRLSRKEKDTYEFLDYLMNSGYTITKEEN